MIWTINSSRSCTSTISSKIWRLSMSTAIPFHMSSCSSSRNISSSWSSSIRTRTEWCIWGARVRRMAWITTSRLRNTSWFKIQMANNGFVPSSQTLDSVSGTLKLPSTSKTCRSCKNSRGILKSQLNKINLTCKMVNHRVLSWVSRWMDRNSK